MTSARPVALDGSFAFVDNFDLCKQLDWKSVFPTEQPVEVDLGAGDGSFIANVAKKRPDTNFLAVERLLGRARKITRKAARLELANLKVLRLESAYTVKYLLPPGSVQVIHLMFPDPWPKRKQQKFRLVQPEFAQSVAQALKPGGEFRFTTDHEEYFNFGCEIMDAEKALRRADIWNFEQDPQTDFQRLFVEEGRKFYRACWKK